ncbi:MAG TPA: hypothetical protein VN920_04335 [Pyrinomonadaceae bacterium]|nr:hypothetical protein [Pyrinomonadaceae bacterium]
MTESSVDTMAQSSWQAIPAHRRATRLLATTSLIACIAAATIGWILFLGWMVMDLLRWLYSVL